MFYQKTIKDLRAVNDTLKRDLEYVRNQWANAEDGRIKAECAREEFRVLLEKSKQYLDEFEKDLQKSDDCNEALNEENADLHEENRYLSGMAGLYESVLASLRVPVKLPARKTK